jgi:hypothetical protein
MRMLGSFAPIRTLPAIPAMLGGVIVTGGLIVYFWKSAP